MPDHLNFREAYVSDIPQLQVVRNSVKENILSDPGLVTYQDYVSFITEGGKGWICEISDKIVGFAIVNLIDHNVWALFVLPGNERMGVGKSLHDLMLGWYFSQTGSTIWLSTSPGTRAENFYRKAGWRETGVHGKGEIKFEMNLEEWKINRAK